MLVSGEGLVAVGALDVQRLSTFVNLDIVTVQDQVSREPEVAGFTKSPEV